MTDVLSAHFLVTHPESAEILLWRHQLVVVNNAAQTITTENASIMRCRRGGALEGWGQVDGLAAPQAVAGRTTNNVGRENGDSR